MFRDLPAHFGFDAPLAVSVRERRTPTFSGAAAIAGILDSSAGGLTASGGRISEILASGSARNLSQAIDQLNPTERNALQARWGRSLDELISLSNERDARVFHHGLLQVGRRLEDNDQVDLAGVVYSSLVAEGSNSPHPPLNLRGGEEVVPPLRLRGGQEGLLPSDVANQAQRRLNAINGVGDWRERFAFSLQRIPNQATRWDVLLAMTGAGFTFRGFRLLTTASWAGSFESALALNAASASTAFLAETIAFTSLGKVAGALAGHPQDTSANGIFNEWAGGAAMLLGLKGMGALTGAGVRSIYGEGIAATATGRLTQILAPQAGMFMGILVGNRLAEAGGFHPERHGDTWLVDGITTLIEFNVAGRIQRAVGGPALTSLEARMDAMTRNIGHGSGRPGGIWDGRSKDRPLPGIFESMSEWMRPELLTPEGFRLPVPEASGNRERNPLEETTVFNMGNDGDGPSRPKTRREPSILFVHMSDLEPIRFESIAEFTRKLQGRQEDFRTRLIRADVTIELRENVQDPAVRQRLTGLLEEYLSTLTAQDPSIPPRRRVHFSIGGGEATVLTRWTGGFRIGEGGSGSAPPAVEPPAPRPPAPAAAAKEKDATTTMPFGIPVESLLDPRRAYFSNDLIRRVGDPEYKFEETLRREKTIDLTLESAGGFHPDPFAAAFVEELQKLTGIDEGSRVNVLLPRSQERMAFRLLLGNWKYLGVFSEAEVLSTANLSPPERAVLAPSPIPPEPQALPVSSNSMARIPINTLGPDRLPILLRMAYRRPEGILPRPIIIDQPRSSEGQRFLDPEFLNQLVGHLGSEFAPGTVFEILEPAKERSWAGRVQDGSIAWGEGRGLNYAWMRATIQSIRPVAEVQDATELFQLIFSYSRDLNRTAETVNEVTFKGTLPPEHHPEIRDFTLRNLNHYGVRGHRLTLRLGQVQQLYESKDGTWMARLPSSIPAAETAAPASAPPVVAEPAKAPDYEPGRPSSPFLKAARLLPGVSPGDSTPPSRAGFAWVTTITGLPPHIRELLQLDAVVPRAEVFMERNTPLAARDIRQITERFEDAVTARAAEVGEPGAAEAQLRSYELSVHDLRGKKTFRLVSRGGKIDSHVEAWPRPEDFKRLSVNNALTLIQQLSFLKGLSYVPGDALKIEWHGSNWAAEDSGSILSYLNRWTIFPFGRIEVEVPGNPQPVHVWVRDIQSGEWRSQG